MREEKMEHKVVAPCLHGDECKKRDADGKHVFH